jgi:hypothetical protein
VPCSRASREDMQPMIFVCQRGVARILLRRREILFL